MKPQNRRISRPNLPPDVLARAGIDDFESREERAFASAEPMFAPPPSKVGAIARVVGGAALVVLVSSTVAWGARHHVMTSPRFAVTDIVVSGQRQRTAALLAGEAGIAKGANVFSVDLDQARARLLADPWISDATLARRLPGTILVQVTERELGAIVALDGSAAADRGPHLGESYLASRDGEIFKRLEAGDPSDLPVITGLRSESVADDREGAARMIRRALDLASDYEHGPLAQRAPLEEIHFAGDGAITLVVGKDALAIVIGEPPFRKKLEQAARIVAELDHRGAHADAIMLDDARPERVVVRMR